MKKFLGFLLALLVLPSVASAQTGQFIPFIRWTLATGTQATTTSLFSTTASSTNLYVGNSISLLNSGEQTTLNGLCIALTGSAALCDGNDAAGSGGAAAVATSTAETSGRIPFWTSTAGTPATLSGGVAGLAWNSGTSELTSTNHLFTLATGTSATTTNLRTTSLGVGTDYLTDITGSGLSISAGALGLTSNTISGVALGSNLADLTAGTGITSAGTYNGGTARTFSVDQSFTPTWTGAHIFNNITRSTTTDATSTNFFTTTASSTNTYGGGLSTCTGTNALTWSGGRFSCTAQPQGTVTSVTGTWPIISSGGATPAISFGGLSTTSPWTIGQVVYVNSNGLITSVATSSLSAGTGISTSATLGNLVGGSNASLSIDQSFSPTWTGNHIFNSITRSTTTDATTTSLFATTASTTNFFGAGLTTCQSGSVLTYNGAGKFGCATDQTGGGGGSDPFTHPSAGISATTSSMLVSNATSTFSGGLTFTTGTSTSATTTNIFATTASTTNFYASIGNALGLFDTAGKLSAYGGTSCTNQFVRSLSALGAATCATVGASDVSLANLTATDATLSFSGTYNGSTARTIGINLATLNTWSGGLMSTASSTIGGGTNASGLTIAGGATTTGKFIGTDTTNNFTGRLSPTRSLVLQTGTTTTWTASTTGTAYSPFTAMPFAGTLKQARCLTDASFLGVNVQVNGSNATPSYFVASTTVGVIQFSAGNTFTAGQKILLNFGTTTTASTLSISCTLDLTETP